MQHIVIKNNNQHGFTLLEIMLVLLLIGMISVGVVMTLPDNLNSEDQVDWQAQRFSALLQFAEDEALMSGRELGLVFSKRNKGYQFAFYDYSKKKWLAFLGEKTLKQVELPDTVEIEYNLLGSVWDEREVEDEDGFIDDQYLVDISTEEERDSLTPQVYVMSSGEVTPFSVEFSAQGKERTRETQTVSVSMSGAITLFEIEKQ